MSPVSLLALRALKVAIAPLIFLRKRKRVRRSPKTMTPTTTEMMIMTLVERPGQSIWFPLQGCEDQNSCHAYSGGFGERTYASS